MGTNNSKTRDIGTSSYEEEWTENEDTPPFLKNEEEDVEVWQKGYYYFKFNQQTGEIELYEEEMSEAPDEDL
jgi:hypothetical protein